MRRDIGFYIEANIQQVYEAYLNAATHKPFERTCDQTPYHTISFGVNFSVKYNFNGGACNIHFMPSGTGTAVNMRFSLAQAFGARYEQYAHDLNRAMQEFLPVIPRSAKYNMDDFLNPANQITPANLQSSAAAVPSAAAGCVPSSTVYHTPPTRAQTSPAYSAPAQTPPTYNAPVQPQDTHTAEVRYCAKCGSALIPGALFCIQCGTQLKVPAPRICSNCQTPAPDDTMFCTQCGCRL